MSKTYWDEVQLQKCQTILTRLYLTFWGKCKQQNLEEEFLNVLKEL